MSSKLLSAVVCLATVLLGQSLEEVKREPDAEKRYQLALDVAKRSLDEAREAMTKVDATAMKSALAACAEATEFALTSLEAMGRQPYRNTKNYKKAELRTRDLLRRLDTLLKDANVDDRAGIESVYARVNAVHEKLLEGVMSKKS